MISHAISSRFSCRDGLPAWNEEEVLDEEDHAPCKEEEEEVVDPCKEEEEVVDPGAGREGLPTWEEEEEVLDPSRWAGVATGAEDLSPRTPSPPYAYGPNRMDPLSRPLRLPPPTSRSPCRPRQQLSPSQAASPVVDRRFLLV